MPSGCGCRLLELGRENLGWKATCSGLKASAFGVLRFMVYRGPDLRFPEELEVFHFRFAKKSLLRTGPESVLRLSQPRSTRPLQSRRGGLKTTKRRPLLLLLISTATTATTATTVTDLASKGIVSSSATSFKTSRTVTTYNLRKCHNQKFTISIVANRGRSHVSRFDVDFDEFPCASFECISSQV